MPQRARVILRTLVSYQAVESQVSIGERYFHISLSYVLAWEKSVVTGRTLVNEKKNEFPLDPILLKSTH